MVGSKRFVFVASSEFYGWRCEHCGWTQPAPRGGPDEALKQALDALEQHQCDAHKAPPPRVRKATQGGTD